MEVFRELREEKDWRSAYPLLQLLRPELQLEAMLASRLALQSQGYRLLGLFVDAQLVSCAGVVVHPHLERGRELWIHDLVTAKDQRSRGYGALLLQQLTVVARAEGFARLLVHTRRERDDAQRFYETKANFEPYALVYQKICF